MYYVYMVRCEDNSIYTGISVDVERRFSEHSSRGEKCAKYTLSHKVKKVEAVWQTDTKALASKLEYRIKELTKDRKEKLIIDNNNFDKFFSRTLLCDKYSRLVR